LSNEQSVAPDGGYGFGPRHLDFHPSKPWIYASLERQNEVALFARTADTLAPEPKFRKTTLAGSGASGHRQMVGTVHVHPNGRFVYVANRASGTVDLGGRRVFAGGENTLAVFAIDPASGEPTLIQTADTHGIHPRTFHIDPTGRLLAVGHIQGITLRDSTEVPTRLTTFRIGDDGRLSFLRGYDIETGGRFLWWMGLLTR